MKRKILEFPYEKLNSLYETLGGSKKDFSKDSKRKILQFSREQIDSFYDALEKEERIKEEFEYKQTNSEKEYLSNCSFLS